MVLLSSIHGMGSSGDSQALSGKRKGKWESQQGRAAGTGEQSSPHTLWASEIVTKSGIPQGNSQFPIWNITYIPEYSRGCCSMELMLEKPLPPSSLTLPWHCQGHHVPRCHIQGVLGCPTLLKAHKSPAGAALSSVPKLFQVSESMAQQCWNILIPLELILDPDPSRHSSSVC